MSEIQLQQLAANDCDGLAAKKNAISIDRDPDDGTASRRLVAGKLGFAQTRAPIGCEAAVRRAGDRVCREYIDLVEWKAHE